MADRRAAQGGGTANPIDYGQTPALAGGTANGADWFGPGNPVSPQAPAAVAGRRYDIPASANLQQRPRAYEPLDFATLRLLSRSYDILRTVIENRKDQMAALAWNITARDPKAAKADAAKTRILAAEKFFAEPYPGIEWDMWLRMLMEDLFVLDAPTLYRRKNRGGGLYGLKPMDGATFQLIVDDWGDRPLPPFAAYAQILKGMSAVHYTTDDIIYRPRNPMTDKLYGYGPVEQIVAIVNIGLRRENWQLNYFTRGSLPDALVGTPNEWTPDQIRNFQDWWDARLQGNTESRSGGVTFVPGDVAKGVVQTKDTELFGAAEEWIARVICFAFSISPSAFTKMVNRATATTAKQTALQEGLEPLKNWVKRLIDYVLRVDLKSPDLQLSWAEEVEIDPKVQSDILDQKVRSGRLTLNEARGVDGDDPYDAKKVPEADMPLVLTATGFTPVGIQDQIDQSKAKMEAMPPPPPPPQIGHNGGPALEDGQQPAPGEAPPPGGSGAKPNGSGGKGGKDSTKAAASDLPPELAKAMAPITADRPAARRAKRAIAKAATSALKAAGESVAEQVTAALRKAHARKADDPVKDAVDVDALVASLDLSSLDTLIDATEPEYFDLASDSALKALAQVGVKANGDLVNRVNERAAAFAKSRSAELVGKRVMADGSVIDNPNAKFAITDSTRDMIRATIERGLTDNIGTPAIADSLEEAYAFSPERATLIANTEVGNANEQSKLDGYRDASDAGVVLKKAWLTAGDDKVDEDICAANEAQGAIDLNEDFQSGDDAPLGHPACRCVLIPIVEESADNGAEDDDDAADA